MVKTFFLFFALSAMALPLQHPLEQLYKNKDLVKKSGSVFMCLMCAQNTVICDPSVACSPQKGSGVSRSGGGGGSFLV